MWQQRYARAYRAAAHGVLRRAKIISAWRVGISGGISNGAWRIWRRSHQRKNINVSEAAAIRQSGAISKRGIISASSL